MANNIKADIIVDDNTFINGRTTNRTASSNSLVNPAIMLPID